MAIFERSTGCGLVSEKQLNSTITLAGWVNRRRDHGGLIFIDLRDRSGMMQVVFSPEIDTTAYELAHTLRSEFVISVTGMVVERTPTMPKAGILEKETRMGISEKEPKVVWL